MFKRYYTNYTAAVLWEDESLVLILPATVFTYYSSPVNESFCGLYIYCNIYKGLEEVEAAIWAEIKVPRGRIEKYYREKHV